MSREPRVSCHNGKKTSRVLLQRVLKPLYKEKDEKNIIISGKIHKKHLVVMLTVTSETAVSCGLNEDPRETVNKRCQFRAVVV